MTNLNLQPKGDFLIADTPDKKAYLLPYWLENRMPLRDHIVQHGATFAGQGPIILDPTNIIDVRVYMKPDVRTAVIAHTEAAGPVSFHTKTAFDLHKAGYSDTPLLSLKASLPSSLLPAFTQVAGIDGVRPWIDPKVYDVAAQIGRAPVPA